MDDSNSLDVLHRSHDQQRRSCQSKSASELSIKRKNKYRNLGKLGGSNKKKFKSKSDFESIANLTQILESKSRISINGSTG
jgi:hypothetical protein